MHFQNNIFYWINFPFSFCRTVKKILLNKRIFLSESSWSLHNCTCSYLSSSTQTLVAKNTSSREVITNSGMRCPFLSIVITTQRNVIHRLKQPQLIEIELESVSLHPLFQIKAFYNIQKHWLFIPWTENTHLPNDSVLCNVTLIKFVNFAFDKLCYRD